MPGVWVSLFGKAGSSSAPATQDSTPTTTKKSTKESYDIAKGELGRFKHELESGDSNEKIYAEINVRRQQPIVDSLRATLDKETADIHTAQTKLEQMVQQLQRWQSRCWPEGYTHAETMQGLEDAHLSFWLQCAKGLSEKWTVLRQMRRRSGVDFAKWENKSTFFYLTAHDQTQITNERLEFLRSLKANEPPGWKTTDQFLDPDHYIKWIEKQIENDLDYATTQYNPWASASSR